MIDGTRCELRHALKRLAAGWLIVPILLTACAANGGGGDNDSDTANETVSGSPAPSVVATGGPGSATTTDAPVSPTSFMRPTSIAKPTEPPWPPAVAAAIDEAILVLGLNRDEIRIEAFEEHIWPSTALGCPEPGRSYAQIVIDGYRVVLRVEGESLVYHTDGTGTAVVHCDEGEADEP